MKPPQSIVVVPCAEEGCGGGHLVRSGGLVRALRQRECGAFLFAEKSEGPSARISSVLALVEGFDASWVCTEPPRETAFAIIDGFRTSQEDFEKWSNIAPLIGIDEGGKFRKHFDFLIDLLPGIQNRPNLTAPYFLNLPKNRRPDFLSRQTPLKILVSFGAEDTAGLGIAAAESLDVDSPKMIPNLREHLEEYDLVVTHYGLTAFEALHARVPFLLVSPTRYHEKLAHKAGFISAGIGKTAAGRLGQIVFAGKEPDRNFLVKLAVSCEAAANKFDLDKTNDSAFADYIANIIPLVSRQCRVCGCSCRFNIIARFPERTYRRCKKCGLISMDRLNPPPIEYAKDYFFDFYKKQYGKTYLEDFPSLAEAGKRRLKNITPFLPKSAKSRLLDIGCAYGPFLAAAKAEGFDPEGIEPAEDAVRYVKKTLGIPCTQGFFPTAPMNNLKEYYDAVSLWYVIEHFDNPGIVLNEINCIMKQGGVLAFSTPSSSGVSGRKSLNGFLKNSPADHWTVWRPGICRRILKIHGFVLKKIVVTGHHPERFPLIGKHLKKSSLLFKVCMGISRIFRLGDSFEVYATKLR